MVFKDESTVSHMTIPEDVKNMVEQDDVLGIFFGVLRYLWKFLPPFSDKTASFALRVPFEVIVAKGVM